MKKNKTLNVNGKTLIIDRPIVMGILNCTPDSFYNQGRDSAFNSMILNAEKMINEGAVILDIGGMTTKPGSEEVELEEEWNRIAPIIKEIRKRFSDVFISVDTYRSEIAIRSAQMGADIINDISAGEMDKKMLQTVGELNLPYIAMHMKGKPKSMQQNPHYGDMLQDILVYFINKIRECNGHGIKDVIIDPGFGFGKTLDQNYELLKNMHQFSILEELILIGISRKSMIYNYLNISTEDSLNGTSILNTIALQQGANILRVHDVKEAMQCIEIFEKIN